MQSNRNLSDRELRSLDLKEFLALIQADIRELDALRRKRRGPDPEPKSKAPVRQGRQQAPSPEPEPDEGDPVIPLSLHVVACCGKRLGSFPSLARVRCPFCERWHRAGDFPIDEETCT